MLFRGLRNSDKLEVEIEFWTIKALFVCAAKAADSGTFEGRELIRAGFNVSYIVANENFVPVVERNQMQCL